MTKKKLARVVVPYGACVTENELSVAKILVKTGYDVRFLKTQLVKMPDIVFMGREWEIKTPIGKNSRTIENIMRRALKQSVNIVLDLRYISLAEKKCLREIERQMGLMKRIKNVIVLNRNGKIVDKFCEFEIMGV